MLQWQQQQSCSLNAVGSNMQSQQHKISNIERAMQQLVGTTTRHQQRSWDGVEVRVILQEVATLEHVPR